MAHVGKQAVRKQSRLLVAISLLAAVAVIVPGPAAATNIESFAATTCYHPSGLRECLTGDGRFITLGGEVADENGNAQYVVDFECSAVATEGSSAAVAMFSCQVEFDHQTWACCTGSPPVKYLIHVPHKHTYTATLPLPALALPGHEVTITYDETNPIMVFGEIFNKGVCYTADATFLDTHRPTVASPSNPCT